MRARHSNHARVDPTANFSTNDSAQSVHFSPETKVDWKDRESEYSARIEWKRPRISASIGKIGRARSKKQKSELEYMKHFLPFAFGLIRSRKCCCFASWCFFLFLVRVCALLCYEMRQFSEMRHYAKHGSRIGNPIQGSIVCT